MANKRLSMQTRAFDGIRPSSVPATGSFMYSVEDCECASEKAVAGAFVHEVAHAYQQSITPELQDADKCERAGDLLPVGWGFDAEIEELKRYREDN